LRRSAAFGGGVLFGFSCLLFLSLVFFFFFFSNRKVLARVFHA